MLKLLPLVVSVVLAGGVAVATQNSLHTSSAAKVQIPLLQVNASSNAAATATADKQASANIAADGFVSVLH